MRMRRGLLSLALLAWTAGGSLAGETRLFQTIEPRPAPAASVEISDESGATLSLAGVLPEGQPAILHFWATWCAPCREELPDLAAYAGTLAKDGMGDRLIVIAVEPSPRDRIDRFLTGLGLDGFVTLQDRRNKSGALFGLFGMPETMLLDAGGRVVGRHAGPLDWTDDATRAELAAHLDG